MPLQPTTYSTYLSVPKPNTQPIYPRVPLDWRCNLSTQVVPFDPNATGAQAPVFLGQASESGCIIESVNIISMIRNAPSQVGNSNASPTSGGEFGLGTEPNTVALNFYTKRFGDEKLWLEASVFIPHNQVQFIVRTGYPILPDPQKSWRLGPYEEMYLGLTKAVAAPGINVFARGGQYS